MKLAIAIVFLFIGLVHSAAIDKDAKKALDTVEILETLDIKKDLKRDPLRETIDTKKALDTIETKKDVKRDPLRDSIDTKKALDTIDIKLTVDEIDTKKDSKREPTKFSVETVDAKKALDTFETKKDVKREPTKVSVETIDAKKALDTVDHRAAVDHVDTLVTVDAVETLETKKETKREALDTKKDSVETVDTIKRSFDWPVEIPEGMNSSQCIYKPDESLLSCKGPSTTVECPTEWVTGTWKNTKRFHVLGLAAVPSEDDFWLYIRDVESNSTYTNYTVANGTLKLRLWSGEAASDIRGLNVTDFTCYTKLTKVIYEGCKTPKTIAISSNLTNTVEEVGLCGEVLIFDKTIQKRWLYGYGWGLGGYGGWGWGGFPYYGGFPFWG